MLKAISKETEGCESSGCRKWRWWRGGATPCVEGTANWAWILQHLACRSQSANRGRATGGIHIEGPAPNKAVLRLESQRVCNSYLAALTACRGLDDDQCGMRVADGASGVKCLAFLWLLFWRGLWADIAVAGTDSRTAITNGSCGRACLAHALPAVGSPCDPRSWGSLGGLYPGDSRI